MTPEEIRKLADEAWEKHWKHYFLNQETVPQPFYADFINGFKAAYKSLRSKVPEPSNKKTITLYQAVFKYTDIDRYYIPDDLFSCAQDAVERSTLIFVKLLTGRPIEIEVEE